MQAFYLGSLKGLEYRRFGRYRDRSVSTPDHQNHNLMNQSTVLRNKQKKFLPV